MSGEAKKSVAFTTLGCRSNQYDSAAMEDAFKKDGFQVVPFSSRADAYVINTCTVTAKTDSQSRQAVRRVRKTSPDAVVVVTGCYAQVSPDEASGIEGVDYVLGNPEKAHVLECVKKGRRQSVLTMVGVGSGGVPLTLRAEGSSVFRTRMNLKVQDGCNRACAYCIIPKARGASKSVAFEEVLSEIEAAIAAGYREIILTGIHLGAYGADLRPAKTLVDIISEAEKRRFAARIRISSLDPDEVTGELIAVMKGSGVICNHLHLPAQSGDDRVLCAMKRPYTAADFARVVEKLVEAVPEIAVGTDVIAGFPGETEKEFSNAASFFAGLPLAYMHVFPYSKRAGTAAAAYEGAVSSAAIKERAARLLEIDAAKRAEFYARFIGKEAEILVESERDKKTGLLKGRARNYIQTFVDAPDAIKGNMARVRLTEAFEKHMKGVL